MKRRLSPLLWPALAAGLWTLVEWLRQFSPLGVMLTLAQSQTHNPRLFYMTSLGGPWLLDFLIVFVCACLVLVLRHRKEQPLASRLLGQLGAALLVLALGLARSELHFRTEDRDAPGAPQLRVAVIQPGIPMPAESSELDDDEASSLDYIGRLSEATRRMASQGAELIVWPEGILQIDPRLSPRVGARLSALSQGSHVHLVVPFFAENPSQGGLYNDGIVYDSDGKVVAQFSKQHASPDENEIVAHYPPAVFEMQPPGRAPVKVGLLTCFDLDFFDVSRALVRQGAQILIAPSDDAYPRYARWHFSQAALQAARFGVPVVKADAAWGSGFFDRSGRILRLSSTEAPLPFASVMSLALGPL